MALRNTRLHIFSRNAVKSTDRPGDFVVQFPKRINGVVKARFIGASVPMTMYQIDEYSDSLEIEESDDAGIDRIRTLSISNNHGTYSVDDLMDTLNNKSTLTPIEDGNTYTFSYNDNSKKVTISAACGAGNIGGMYHDWCIYVNSENQQNHILASEILGFKTSEALGGDRDHVQCDDDNGVFEAEDEYHGFGNVNNFYIICYDLFNNDQYLATDRHLNRGCVGVIPASFNLSVVHYTPNPGVQPSFDFYPPRSIEQLHIQVVARLGKNDWRIVNFQGRDINLVFEIVQSEEI